MISFYSWISYTLALLFVIVNRKRANTKAKNDNQIIMGDIYDCARCRWICQILNSEKFINNVNGKLSPLIFCFSSSLPQYSASFAIALLVHVFSRNRTFRRGQTRLYGKLFKWRWKAYVMAPYTSIEFIEISKKHCTSNSEKKIDRNSNSFTSNFVVRLFSVARRSL